MLPNSDMSLFFSYKDIANIAFDVLHGLAFLNAQGIVHRNLSPRNISITPKVSDCVEVVL